MNKSLIAILVIAAAVVGLMFLMRGGTPAPVLNEVTVNDTTNKTVETPVTGNVDDAVAAILLDASLADETPLAESDPSVLSENDQAINDFGLSLDASQF